MRVADILQDGEFTTAEYEVITSTAITKMQALLPDKDDHPGQVWHYAGEGFCLRADCDTEENRQLIRETVLWAASGDAALEQAKKAKIEELRRGWAELEKEPLLTSMRITVLVEPIDISRWQQLHSFVAINHATYPEGHEKRQEIFEIKDAFDHWHSLTTEQLLPLLDEIASYYQTSVYGRFAVKEGMVLAAASVEAVESISF